MLVDFPNRLDEHEHDLCTNLTQKRRTVHFSLSTTLYYYPDVLEDKVASSWYTSEEQQRFKQMARQEMAWFIKMIEDSRYVGIRLKHGMSPVGREQAIISRSHLERRVISKMLVTCTVLDEQVRSVPNEDNIKRIAIASMQHSKWSRVHAQAVAYIHALVR
jgi:predicted cupin superfamily sugar epimerase